jgi:hypothetical protein
MRESLAAACGQFEQVILADMLRTAGIGKSGAIGSDDADTTDEDATVDARSSDDAFQQLVVQALSGALESAGGIGLQRALRDDLAEKRS